MLSFACPVFAQGIKYTGGESQRFEEKYDEKYGWIIHDNDQKIEVMLCPLGMTSNADKKECLGEMQQLDYRKISDFANRVGAGWRLPSVDEMYNYARANSDFLNVTDNFSSGFNGQFYWTNTGVTNYPESLFTINVFESTSRNSWRVERRTKNDDNNFSVFFVRDFKAPIVNTAVHKKSKK